MADPAPLSFKTRRGGGGVAYKDRARPPPRDPNTRGVSQGGDDTYLNSVDWDMCEPGEGGLIEVR